MADILITVVVGLCVAAMAALGVYVSFVPLPPYDSHQPFIKRRAVWVSAVFVLLTIVIVSLSAIQTYRGGKQQEILARSLEDVRGTLKETQNQLQTSALSEEFMKGQLSGLSMMVGKLNSDGSSASENLIKALHQIGDEQLHPGVQPPAIQRMTNAQLREKVIQLANALRKDCSDVATQIRNPNGEKGGPPDVNRVPMVINDFELRLRQLYVGDSTVYKDELLRRLGPQNPPLSTNETWWMTDGSIDVGYWQALGTADYLERLAKQLPQ